MADIKQRISLDGADDVASKLKKIGDTGSDAFKKLKEYSDRGGEGFSKFGRETEDLEIGEKLKETLHTLHPVLDEAGLGLENLGAFARLAGAGMLPLGAALAGSVLVGLAKVGEETDRTKSRLKGLGAGEGGFEDLSKQAKALGVEISSLQPRYEKFISFQQRSLAGNRSISHPPNFVPGEAEETAAGVRVLGGSGTITPPSKDSFQQFDKALFEEIRRDVGSADDAGKIADEFEQSLYEKGLTPDALKSLQGSAPNAADFVTKSLTGLLGGGFSNPNELATRLQRGDRQVSATDLINEGAKNVGRADKDAEAARGVTAAFEGLKASAGRLAEELGGDRGITHAVDGLTHVIDQATEHVDQFLHPRDYEPGGPKFTGPVSSSEQKEYNKPDIIDVGKALLTGQADDRFKDSNAIAVAKALHNGPTGLQKTPDEGLRDLIDAAHQPGAINQQQLPLLNETNRGSGVSTNLSPDETGPWAAGSAAFEAAQKALANQPQGKSALETWPAPPPPEKHSEAEGSTAIASLGSLFQQAGADSSQAIRDGFGQSQQAEQEQTGILQQILSAIAALVNKANPPNTRVDGDVGTIGVRGATGGLIRALADGGRIDALGGGHLSGPGGPTGDKIPLWGSAGEVMIKASSVNKIGADRLLEINEHPERFFAEGGVTRTGRDNGNASSTVGNARSSLGPGQHSVLYDPQSGGAYVDGLLHLPGDPLLNDPIVRKGMEESKAGMNQKTSSKKHSEFVGRFGYDVETDTGSGFAEGGIIGRSSSGSGSWLGSIGHFASGGQVTGDIDAVSLIGGDRFDAGGRISASDLAALPSGDDGAGAGGRHYGTADLRTDHGDFPVMGEHDVLDKLTRATMSKSRRRTGVSPGWQGA
ncbi:hypothetical protein ACE10Z_23670 [Bradyrhizobium sp. Pha-3]|uniref:hypothetical protein n=1 Tax=Bradyrhizobium sp. Pha-3 TaxID=208375 RepID=UPI0035D4AE2E